MLREIRTQKGLTQQELADLTNCTRQLISSIERGVSSPSVTQARKLAEHLSCDWTIFFENKEVKLYAEEQHSEVGAEAEA